MERYLTKDVFTPTIPAKLTFVERDEINNQIVSALKQPGKQIVVYGHSGSGKTTLLVNKLNQLYENHITSRCSESISVAQLMLDAFDKLNRFYTSEYTSKKGWKIGSEIGADYLFIKSKLTGEFSSERENKSQRIVPPQLTMQRLAEFLGAAKCCWVIEDFHKVKIEEKTELAQSIKIFMDTASDFPDVKVAAIGAVGTAREVIAYDKEMQNRVAEIHVSLMNKSQLREIMIKGENLLNIKIEPSVQNRIIDLANGLGAVCHQLCLNMCNYLDIYETLDDLQHLTLKDLDNAVKQYINEQSDTFKATFENAIKVRRKGGKYESGKLIITALSNLQNEYASLSEILSEIHDFNPNYPSGSLTAYLKMLTSAEKDEILRYDEKSGKYSFSNPFLKVYSKMILSGSQSVTKRIINTKSYIEETQNIQNQIQNIQIGNSNISFIRSKRDEHNVSNVNVSSVKRIRIGFIKKEIIAELTHEIKVLLDKIHQENKRMPENEILLDALRALENQDIEGAEYYLSRLGKDCFELAKNLRLRVLLDIAEILNK